MSNSTARLQYLFWLTLLLSPTTSALSANNQKDAEQTPDQRTTHNKQAEDADRTPDQRKTHKQAENADRTPDQRKTHKQAENADRTPDQRTTHNKQKKDAGHTLKQRKTHNKQAKKEHKSNNALAYGALAFGTTLIAFSLYSTFGKRTHEPGAGNTNIGTDTEPNLGSNTSGSDSDTDIQDTGTEGLPSNTGNTEGKVSALLPKYSCTYQIPKQQLKAYLPKLVEQACRRLEAIPTQDKYLVQEGHPKLKNEQNTSVANNTNNPYLYQALEDIDTFVATPGKTWQIVIAKPGSFECGVGIAWKEGKGEGQSDIIVCCHAKAEKRTSHFNGYDFTLSHDAMSKAKKALENADPDNIAIFTS